MEYTKWLPVEIWLSERWVLCRRARAGPGRSTYKCTAGAQGLFKGMCASPDTLSVGQFCRTMQGGSLGSGQIEDGKGLEV